MLLLCLLEEEAWPSAKGSSCSSDLSFCLRSLEPVKQEHRCSPERLEKEKSQRGEKTQECGSGPGGNSLSIPELQRELRCSGGAAIWSRRTPPPSPPLLLQQEVSCCPQTRETPPASTCQGSEVKAIEAEAQTANRVMRVTPGFRKFHVREPWQRRSEP